MFFVLYKRADDAVFDDIPKISDHFLKISEDFPKLFRGPDERFQTFWRLSRIAEDSRRRLKKIWRCSDHTPTNCSVAEGTKEKCYQTWYLHMTGYHIFTYKDIILFLLICYHSVYHWLLYNKTFSYIQMPCYFVSCVWWLMKLKTEG